MKTVIDYIHNDAAARFEKFLDKRRRNNETLCDLEATTYKRQIPDYANEAHASLYLMRYASAYLAEYYLAYKRLFEKNFLDLDKISILSLGSGAHIDGLAAGCALLKLYGKANYAYQGVDKIDWPGSNKLCIPFFKFIHKDIGYLEDTDLNLNYPINIIVFPKVLSEICSDAICGLFLEMPEIYLDQRLALVFSTRNAQQQSEMKKDHGKMKSIVDFITSGALKIRDQIHIQGNDDEFRNKYINNVPELPGMKVSIDEKIRNLAKDPGQYCCKKNNCSKRDIYIDEAGYLTCDCIETIGRSPIVKTNYFDSHIYLLEKK